MKEMWHLIFYLSNTYAYELKLHSHGNRDINSKYKEYIRIPFGCMFLSWSVEIYMSNIF